jgi:hypothetical protein
VNDSLEKAVEQTLLKDEKECLFEKFMILGVNKADIEKEKA